MIGKEHAKEIKISAENVKKAAAAGDQDATLDNAKILKDQVDRCGAPINSQQGEFRDSCQSQSQKCGIGYDCCSGLYCCPTCHVCKVVTW